MPGLTLFLVFLKASALSVGGLASLPLLRAELVPGYVTDAQLVQALAIGRLTPGPNGLYIVSLGYLAAGWYGALASLVAASLAPLVILPGTALARRWLLSAPFAGVVRGVALGTAGLLVSTGVTIMQPGATAPWQLALAAVAVALTIHGRLHPGILIALGALAGLAFAR